METRILRWAIPILCSALAAACSDEGAGDPCVGPLLRCDAECVDTEKDSNHCGACGARCHPGETCDGGRCISSCSEEGRLRCGDSCVDPQSDARHCGGCELSCAQGQVCVEGVCSDRCPEGQEPCGDRCVDLRVSDEHCGACDQACEAGRICKHGECIDACEEGRTPCGGRCADLESDVANCGACGVACEEGLVCVAGKCACPGELTRCDERCVDVTRDASHCGACGATCLDRPNAERGVCELGSCALDCSDGFADCDGDVVNGCEARISEDLEHCGACGASCLDLPYVEDALCIDGSCEIAACAPGWDDCDRDNETGCETHLESDIENCGACGHSCVGLPNNEAAPACVDGRCDVVCAEGWEDCDGIAVNGCEAFLEDDRLHCGACGVECDYHCSEGRCREPVQLIGGNQFSCALFDDGLVSCWGGNPQFWTGDEQRDGDVVPQALSTPTGVEVLAYSSGGANCAATREGEVVCWGQSNGLVASPPTPYIPPVAIEGLPDEATVRQMALIPGINCALLSTDAVWCWGNIGGTTFVPPTALEGVDEDVVEVSAGLSTLCARTRSGKVWCWGMGLEGANLLKTNLPPHLIENLPDALSLGTSKTMSMCAVTVDEQVVCWGNNNQGQLGQEPGGMIGPSIVSGLEGVRAVGTGLGHSCARTSGGEVYCWGANAVGQSGRVGDASPTPGKVEGLSQVVELLVSSDHNCARREDGQILCWGNNENGQLGRVTAETFDPEPQPVSFR